MNVLEPIDPYRLKEVLGQRPLLLEEEKMWMNAGFYIEPTSCDGSSVPENWNLWDFSGNRSTVSRNVGQNMRLLVISRWERAKIPVLFPAIIPVTGLTEEEAQNMISMEERSRS